jgi:hypothetical protein
MSICPFIRIRLNGLGEVAQAQQIRHRAARASNRFRRGVVRHTEFVDQPLQSVRLLERIQVLALDVLDQRERKRRLVGH